LKYHRWNARVLASLVGIHVLLGLSLYFFPPQTGALPATTSVAPIETTEVSMRNYAFEPKAIAVTRGDTVVWTNEDPIPHDVSIGDSVSPALSKGQTYSFTFDTAGTFDYFCPTHPFMRGTVVVR